MSDTLPCCGGTTLTCNGGERKGTASMRFSERLGITQVRSVIQVESIDTPLRNRLWSILYVHLDAGEYIELAHSRQQRFYRTVWLNFLEQPIDRMPMYVDDVVAVMRTYFYGDEWFKAYDMLEFCISNFEQSSADAARKLANEALEYYLAGYRFVSGTLVPIIDDTHVQAIERAIESATTPARTHLTKSLVLLGDRQRPDVENAMKEAVSAVEAICSAIVGERGTTLGAALKRLEDSGVVLHGALKESWLKMYGYTSDADGIRHALHGESNVTVDDALYFVITCSAFVSLLTARAASAGITLSALPNQTS